MRRFYKKDIVGESIVLKGQEAHHMTRVLRMQPGDDIILFDGSGVDYFGQLIKVEDDETRICIKEKQESENEPNVNITLCQAIIKNNNFEYAVEKCTELGVRRFVPFVSHRCVRRPKSEEHFMKRVNRRVLEAVKQCGRSYLPLIDSIHSFEELMRVVDGEHALFANENEQSVTIKQALQSGNGLKEFLLIVGPEGGFTDEEADALGHAGAQSITLGRRILRSETAGVVASSMVLYEWMPKEE